MKGHMTYFRLFKYEYGFCKLEEHPKHSTWPLTCTNDCYLVKNLKSFIGTFRILTHYSPLLLFCIPWKQKTFPVFRRYRKATPGCNELSETSKAKHSKADIRQGPESAFVVWFLFLSKKKINKAQFSTEKQFFRGTFRQN